MRAGGVVRVSLCALVLVALLAACNSAPAPVPTLTLIPSTITPTPTTAAATATPQPLTLPEDLSTRTPDRSDVTPNGPLLETDPVAAELTALAQRLLAEGLDIPVRRVRVVDVQAVVWSDGSLGCPLPDQMYTQVLIPGYRIVLEAGDEQVVFHSDFDRAVRCAAENEQLPEGFTPLTEATDEAES